jgi:lipid II:glycine glycyltransferase (peptidoglycan interpeptide bridge formation enzyme)
MAIRKLTVAEYREAAEKANKTLPIEQAPPWLEFDAKLAGRQALGLFAFQPEKSNQPLAIFAMTKYMQPRYKMIWIKHGPTWLKSPNSSDISSFINELKRFGKAQAPEVTFIRLNLPEKPGRHARPSMHKVMYDRTVIIDLTKNDEDRLADMTQGGRRALRKAWQAKLTTKEITDINQTNFAELYNILEETAARDRFGVHPKNLYLTMLESLGKYARLFVIYQNKQPLAWAIVTVYNQRAVYYYGASSAQARDLNAPYQLHWDIMQILKKEGAKAYDFMGIASEGHEHLKNVSVFKEKFSRSTSDVPPSYDLVLQAGRYKLLGILRKTRQKIRFV